MIIWSRMCVGATVALSLAGCANAAMMGGMGVGMILVTRHEMRKASRVCADEIALTRVHLQRLDAAGGDSLPALIPVHREQVAALVSRCIEASTDTTWRPLGRELRQDAGRLPQLSAAELPAFMADHRARIERYLAWHERKRHGKEGGTG